jgi:hypothetical protein
MRETVGSAAARASSSCTFCPESTTITPGGAAEMAARAAAVGSVARQPGSLKAFPTMPMIVSVCPPRSTDTDAGKGFVPPQSRLAAT